MTEVLQEHMDKASKTLATMLDYLGLEASIKAEQAGDKITLVATSDDAGRIIGRKGQALESLQLLLNRMMLKASEEFPRIMIDVDGYTRKKPARRGGFGGRKRRDDSVDKKMLEQQALDAAKEVKRWGEAVTLPEMNAHDRRIIHITLKEDNEVETSSIGEGNRKKITVSLKK